MIPQAFLSRPVSAATQMKPSLPHQLDHEFLQAQVQGVGCWITTLFLVGAAQLASEVTQPVMTTRPQRCEHHCIAPQRVFTSHLSRMQMRCGIQHHGRCSTTDQHLIVLQFQQAGKFHGGTLLSQACRGRPLT